MASSTRTVMISSDLDPVTLFGPLDEKLHMIDDAFDRITMIVRPDHIALQSTTREGHAQASRAQEILDMMIQAAYETPMETEVIRWLLDQQVLSNDVRHRVPGTGRAAEQLRTIARQRVEDERQRAAEWKKPSIPGVIAYAGGMPVRPKTAGQVAYVNAIEKHTITFGIGPAGTGKTYLAVAKAVQAFRNGAVRRIVLTRPAVEAGESLGFLPGTLNDKVDPYLRPLYDALSDMLGSAQLKRYMEDGSIEVAPLAYMRGRTLNDAFVILDEAQNTTEQQMKMFLTRLGFNTKMVVTGDVTQIDLAVPHSGLRSIESILNGINDIAFMHLTADDVVRHSLVGKIVEAYDIDAEKRASRRANAHNGHVVPIRKAAAQAAPAVPTAVRATSADETQADEHEAADQEETA